MEKNEAVYVSFVYNRVCVFEFFCRLFLLFEGYYNLIIETKAVHFTVSSSSRRPEIRARVHTNTEKVITQHLYIIFTNKVPLIFDKKNDVKVRKNITSYFQFQFIFSFIFPFVSYVVFLQPIKILKDYFPFTVGCTCDMSKNKLSRQ